MDLTFTPEQDEFRAKVRAFLDENVPQSGLGGRHEGRIDQSWLANAKAWQRKLYDAGYVALSWPKEYGGQAMDPVRQAIVNEEMVRARAPLLIGGQGIGMLGPTLIALRHRGAKAPLSAEGPHRRGNLVPGLLGAGRGLRPGLAADARRDRRRRIRRQRAEGLDLRRRSWRT